MFNALQIIGISIMVVTTIEELLIGKFGKWSSGVYIMAMTNLVIADTICMVGCITLNKIYGYVMCGLWVVIIIFTICLTIRETRRNRYE